MNIDYDFVKDNIEDFIDVYFQFNPANLDREKQYRTRWYNTIGKSSPTSKDRTKIADQTILYIQEIIKLRKEKRLIVTIWRAAKWLYVLALCFLLCFLYLFCLY